MRKLDFATDLVTYFDNIEVGHNIDSEQQKFTYIYRMYKGKGYP